MILVILHLSARTRLRNSPEKNTCLNQAECDVLMEHDGFCSHQGTSHKHLFPLMQSRAVALSRSEKQYNSHQQVKWKIRKRHGHNPNYCSSPSVFSTRNSSDWGPSHRISKQLPDPSHFRKAETGFCGLTLTAKEFFLRGWSKSVDCAACRI